MRNFITAVLVAACATAAMAQDGVRRHTPRMAGSDLGLTAPSAAAPADVVRNYLRHDARTLAVAQENRTMRGITHLRMAQVVDGLPVYGAYVKAAIDRQGRLRNVIDDTVDVSAPVTRTALTASDALNAALAHRFQSVQMPALYREPVVQAVIVPRENGVLEQGFLVETWEQKSNLLWHTVIGANGEVAFQELRTNTDSYFIFPVSPGQNVQTLVSGPGTGNAESPAGWVTNNTTIGNNVDAYLDRDNNNAADATNARPVSSTKDFIFTFDLAAAPTTITNQNAAVTSLFYLNNVVHDKLYRHGFNEAAGNFQTNNFGKGGAGNDPVNAEAQDGGGTNNANFSTPTDGSRPRMQMYLWTSATPNRDGDLDSDVVYHEYGHGLTWRMIGSMGGGLAGAIGEGMADTVACYINANDVVGEYSKNNNVGIRRYPYENYPLTYRSATTTSVHANGEVYAAAMWKLRKLWLASGNSMDDLWNYVIDGMNYTPANPEYEEMRNGILQAVPTQAQDCIVWDAFASLGIGVNAAGSDSCNFLGQCTIQITEDFSKPAECGGTPVAYTLSTRGYTSGGRPRVDLTWGGGAGANVDVFRNGTRITTTTNDGAHTDSTLAKSARGTFTYKVCNAGTTTCSNDSSVTF
jgi:extracellular elastinolytic metalloproteinase